MKKLIILFAALLTLSASAQSVRLIYDGRMLNLNDTIDVAAVQDEQTNVYLGYMNVSGSDGWFTVKKEVVTALPGAASTFCVSTSCCEFQSPEFQVYAGDSVGDSDEQALHLIYMSPSAGQSIYRFIFQNSDDENDASAFYVRYTQAAGIQSALSAPALTASPNPAVSTVKISYNAAGAEDSYVVIRNLAGKEVFRAPASVEGRTIVNVSSFSSGIYLYGLDNNGRMVVAKKLIVK
ncbi:MAG: T9SS type A sorting domain-containing protein [Bacteroidales bacterium]|nr:T9SS type A sorting domain-containing protein [Bacteroidales bacterium]